MLFARFEVSKTTFSARVKSVELSGLFGSVYAPKSRLKEVIEIESGAVIPHVCFLVPFWVFSKSGMNPCQFDGYMETLNV